MLRLARQYREKTQQEVADASGLKQSHYSRLENGLLHTEPHRRTVQAVASALSFPYAFFFQPDGMVGMPLSIHPMYRRKASLSVATISSTCSHLNLRLIHLRRLLRAFELSQQLPCPYFDVDEHGGPAAIARNLRRTWTVSSGPFPDLTEHCEQAGIMVLWCDLGEGLDGVTMQVSDLPPCIFLNRKTTADRMRFTLAHELGHIVMHRIATDSMEDEANLFAGELLVPREELIDQVKGSRIDIPFLARLKAYWRTSMQFILVRIGQEELITRHHQVRLWKQLSARGWRIREPEETDIEYEQPSLFRYIFLLHQEDLDYTAQDFCRLLCIRKRDLKLLYHDYLPAPAPQHPHLRLVSAQ